MSEKPKEFTPELGEEICHRISSGETMISICLDDHMPLLWRARRWCAGLCNAPDTFVRAYAKARIEYADSLVDQMQNIADTTAVECEMEAEAAQKATLKKTGNEKLARIAYHKQRRESESARRQRIDVRKWIASRVNRKVYGERIGISDDTPTDQIRKSVDLSSCNTEQLEVIAKLAEGMPDVEPSD